MFADIMTPVVAMGVDVELVEGVGPVVREPVRTLAAVERLRVPDPEETLAPVLEAIGDRARASSRPSRRSSASAAGRSRSPGYLVEGKPSRDFAVTKALMYARARRLARADGEARGHVRGVRGRAGAGRRRRRAALRLVGRRPLAGRLRGVRRAVVGAGPRGAPDAGVPTIHFGTGTATLLPTMAAAGGDVIGLDWRIPLDAGWAAVGEERGVQGNLDPAVLLGPWARVEAAARDVLARAGGRPGPHLQPRPRRPAAHRPGRARPRARARPRGRPRPRRTAAGGASPLRHGPSDGPATRGRRRPASRRPRYPRWLVMSR